MAIAGLPFGHRQNSREATSEAGEAPAPCAPEADRGVWFRLTAANSERVQLSTAGSNYRTVLSVWLGEGHPLQPLACADSGFQQVAGLTFATQAGVTYWLKVEAVGSGGDLLLYAASPAPPPANDNLAAAVEIDTLPFRHQVALDKATVEAGELATGCGGDRRGVWYRYRPSADGWLRLDSLSTAFDTVLSAWVGSRHPLLRLACQSGNRGGSPALTVAVKAGQTYYIRAESAGLGPDTSPAGPLVLNAYLPIPPPPDHDDLANTLEINALPFAHDTDTRSATTEPEELLSSCGAKNGDPQGVWYRYQAASSQRLPLYVPRSAFDVVLSVWTGAGHPLSELLCSDGIEHGPLNLDVAAGETYYIKLEGFAPQQSGQVSLEIGPGAPIPPRPVNDDLAHALEVGRLPFEHAVDTSEATTEPAEALTPCGYGLNRHGVWYRVQVDRDSRLPVAVADWQFDVVASVWTGTGNPLQLLDCSDAVESQPLIVDLAAGRTYWVKIEGYGAFGGRVRLVLGALLPPPARPANDDLATAMEITALPFEHAVDTSRAGNEAGELIGTCGGPSANTRSVWYRYTAPADGRLPIWLGQYSFDAVVSVWRGTQHPLQALDCSDVEYVPLRARVLAGQTYLIKIESYRGDGGPVRLNVGPLEPSPPRPENDDLADALEIDSLPFQHTVDISEASTEPDEALDGCAYGTDRHSVWYRFQGAETLQVTVRAQNAAFNVTTSIWTGQGHPLQFHGCSDGSEFRPLVVNVVPGRAYWIKIEGQPPPQAGSIEVLVEGAPVLLPVNDDLDQALDIHLPFEHRVNTAAATTEPGELPAQCAGLWPEHRGVWYRHVPLVTGPVRFDTRGSDYDTVLSVWQGTGHPLRQVDCVDDVQNGERAILQMHVTAGETYWIKVESYADVGGNLVMRAAAPPPPPANDDLAAALAVESLPFSDAADNSAASNEPFEARASCGGEATAGLWYRHLPAADGWLRVSVPEGRLAVSAWVGEQHPLGEIACMVIGTGASTRLRLPVEAGTVYAFKVEPDYDGNRGPFSVVFEAAPPPPAHDDLADAVAIDSLPFSHRGEHLSLATWEPGEGAGSCWANQPGAWYRYEAIEDGRLRLDTASPELGAGALSVWAGTGHPLREVACAPYPDGHQTPTLTLDVKAGETYYVRASLIGQLFDSDGDDLQVNAYRPPPRPENDDLAAAKSIDSLPFHDRLEISEATLEPAELASPCANFQNAGSIWYRFAPTERGLTRLDVSDSAFPALVSVWEGDTHPLVQVSCSSEAWIPLAYEAGEVYYIRVQSNWIHASGDLVFAALTPPPPPANDDRAQATAIETLPFLDEVETSQASAEADEPRSNCQPMGGRSVWCRLTLDMAARVRLDTEGSDFDTVLSVWTEGPEGLSEVACNDDEDTYQAALSFIAQAGRTYFVQVDGYEGMGGRLRFAATVAEGSVGMGVIYLPAAVKP